MLIHVISQAAWNEVGDLYEPASLKDDGFIHFSADEATALAVATAFYSDAPRPLLALIVDESLLSHEVRLERADPTPPPGVAADVLFPHLFGPMERSAVVEIREVSWDSHGSASGLVPHA